MPDLQRTAMDAFDYDLPPELIAQEPLPERTDSRLLVLSSEGVIDHHAFRDLPALLAPGDLLIVNDTRVNVARLRGNRETGADVEVLLLRELSAGTWRALLRPWRRLNEGERISVRPRNGAVPSGLTVVKKLPDGEGVIRLDPPVITALENYGRVPLPPYITRHHEDDNRYQTVYAEHSGSAAAPTAGLHFTASLFERLAARRVARAPVTLHVGLDTFRPITADFAEDHVIHSEWCRVPKSTVTAIINARSRGGRIIAVGTTAARTLEAWGRTWDGCDTTAFEGLTNIFITPGYEWTLVDGLITNFHLPRSSLLLMVSSLVGRERLLGTYREAIAQQYRFFSFGDAMLILSRMDAPGTRR